MKSCYKRIIYLSFFFLVLLSGCQAKSDIQGNSNESVDKIYTEIYSDDSKIVGEAGRCSYSGYEDNNNTEVSGNLSNFYGKIRIWDIVAEKQAKITLEFDFKQTNGKYKVVFVNPANRVSIIIEQLSKGKKSVTLPEGINRIFLVGYNAEIQYSISISKLENAKVK